jgi:hypothetical protein
MSAYFLPFAAYVIISIIGNWFPNGNLYTYPIKTIIVGLILLYFREEYAELFENINIRSVARSIVIGILAFIIWIAPEGLYPQLGYSEFNPTVVGTPYFSVILIIFRITGAVLIVPVFEELFWRSFLARWIIRSDFKSVKIGDFTILSFIMTSLLFGIAHHRWLVGIMVGLLYNWLLYRDKKLLSCVIAHAITNLLLAIYILMTSQWSFW